MLVTEINGIEVVIHVYVDNNALYNSTRNIHNLVYRTMTD